MGSCGRIARMGCGHVMESAWSLWLILQRVDHVRAYCWLSRCLEQRPSAFASARCTLRWKNIQRIGSATLCFAFYLHTLKPFLLGPRNWHSSNPRPCLLPTMVLIHVFQPFLPPVPPQAIESIVVTLLKPFNLIIGTVRLSLVVILGVLYAVLVKCLCLPLVCTV